MPRYLLTSLLVFFTCSAALAQRDAGYGPLYIQAMLGSLDAGEAWTLEDEQTGETLTSDLGNLIFGGGMVQQMTKDGVFEYGFEGGGFVSWKNSNQSFYASNHLFAVSFDNDLFLIDLAFGGAISWRPVSPLRFYLGAGPHIAIATVDIKSDSVEREQRGDSSISVDNAGGRQWAGDVGLYGRAGFECIVNNYTFGIGVRKATGSLEFDTAGEMDLGATQWFLTIGKRI